MDTDTAYCRDLVERFDRDRYILSLFAPKTVRPALWALYAFNHEIAKTRDVVKDIHAGHIRLTWWREALSKFYQGEAMPGHDVACALGLAIQAHQLPQNEFEKLLDARALDLASVPTASLEGLIHYADATNMPLLNLSAKILGIEETHLQGLGIAYGLTGIIRALPFFARTNRAILPLPMLHDIGLMPEQFHHLSSSAALKRSVQMMAQTAKSHLGHVIHPFFSKQQRMVELYLKQIEKAGYDPFDPRVFRGIPFLAIRILF